MGTWITVTDGDAMAPSSAERASITAVKGQDDLADIVAECVETFRDAIRSAGSQLGPDGTIPLALKQYVIDRAIWLFVSRGVPQNNAIQSPARKDSAARAEVMLDKIISKEFKVISDDPNQTISHGVSAIRRGRCVRTRSFDKLGET